MLDSEYIGEVWVIANFTITVNPIIFNSFKFSNFTVYDILVSKKY